MSPPDYENVDEVYRAVRDLSPDVAQSAPAHAAVAVVLWRENAGAAQVYLVRRSPNLRFLGGYWSFPGGRVEDADRAARETAMALVGDTEIACAVREVREELGIEIPRSSDAYTHGGRWVTPEFSPIRFDTHYLLHRYQGPEPDPSSSGGELVEGRWVSAAETKSAWESGRWLIPSPILRVVNAIGECSELGRLDRDHLAQRLGREASLEADSQRVWFPLAGVGLTPLRTPTLPPATHTNCYFFGTDELVVVDPAPSSPGEQEVLGHVLAELASQGRRVRAVLLTHHHGDHVGAASYVADSLGVPIAAHRETAARLRGIARVDRFLEDDEVIELGGHPRRRVRALFTPGHAPGHLCYLEEETGALAAGDMVAGEGTILIDPSEGDMADYLRSLRRLRDLDSRFILPAHGPLIADTRGKLDEYIAHRLWREQRVLAALEDVGRAPARQLVTVAYSDVPPAIHPFAQRSLLAHLVKLAGDGRARQDGEDWVALAAG